jgi:hypothetical protein
MSAAFAMVPQPLHPDSKAFVSLLDRAHAQPHRQVLTFDVPGQKQLLLTLSLRSPTPPPILAKVRLPPTAILTPRMRDESRLPPPTDASRASRSDLHLDQNDGFDIRLWVVGQFESRASFLKFARN